MNMVSKVKVSKSNVKGMNAKRAPASKAIRAVLTPDYNADSPFDEMSMFGSLLICDPSVGNTRNAVGFDDLPDYCNSRFDIDRFYADVYTRDEHRVAEYIRRYGALAVEVRGALVIAGHEQIVHEFGYDNPGSRAKALERLRSEAEVYMQWADGDVWQATVYDDHTDDESVPDAVEVEYDPYGSKPGYGDVVDSLGGLYGEDYARSEARDMIVSERASRGQTPNFAKGSASRRACSRSVNGVSGRPEPRDYAKARFAGRTSAGHSIVRVYYDPWESETMDRPVYDVVAWRQDIPGLIWGKDYDPVSGIWQGGDYYLTRERLDDHVRGHRLIQEYGAIPESRFVGSGSYSPRASKATKPKCSASKTAKPKAKCSAPKAKTAKPKAPVKPKGVRR